MTDNKKLYSQMVKSMMMDFIINDLKPQQLADKYNLSIKAVYTIMLEHKFKDKRVQYNEKLLSKSVDKLATRQAGIYSRITSILERQVERIEQQQFKDPEKLVDPTRMKEVLTAFALLSKEYRLDNDKPTDNTNMQIKVDFGSDVKTVSENHIINKRPDVEVIPDAVEVPTPEEIKVVVETPSVKDDEIVFGSID